MAWFQLPNFRRLSKKLGVKRSDDPNGVIAVLQVARRLVQDEGFAPTEALNLAANKYAAPIPNNGVFGTHHQSTLPGSVKAQATKPSAASANILPSASARPDALCAFFMPAALTSSERSRAA